MRFEFSDSLRAYCNQPSIKAAVDALLTRPGKVPPDLNWEELPGYYSAWAAAHRMQADYALALAALWDSVWEDEIPASWRPCGIDDQIAYDKHADPHAGQVWYWECITRCHERGNQTLYTCVAFESGSVSIGIGLFAKNWRNAWKVPLPGFEHDPESNLYWSIERAKTGADGACDLAGLLEDRDRVLAALKAQSSAAGEPGDMSGA